MKNISLILNGILALAVAFLYYLHFQKTNTIKPNSTTTINAKDLQEKGMKVMYINGDTLVEKYATYKNSLKQIENKQKSAETQLQKEMEAMQADYVKLQERAQKGQLTQEEGEKAQMRLMQQEENLSKKRTNLLKSIDEQSKKLDESMKSEMKQKLTELQKQLNYDFVLSYSSSGGILFANPELDITNQAIDFLNKK